MCKAMLVEHPTRKPIGVVTYDSRVMSYEGRLIPIRAHVDSLGICNYDTKLVPLMTEGVTVEEFRTNVVALLDEALSKGVLQAVEECKMKMFVGNLDGQHHPGDGLWA